MNLDVENITVSEIKKIIFGVSSPEYIKRNAVCKVNITKLSGYNSVYDPRMGPGIDMNSKCETCNLGVKDCTGHFGYIELNQYVINPLFYKIVHQYLKCFCFNCNRLLLSKDLLELNGFLRYKSTFRFNKIIEKVEKYDICCHCKYTQPKYSFIKNECVFTISSSKKDGEVVMTNLSVNDIKKIFDNIHNDDVELLGFVPTRIHPRNFILSVLPVIPPCSRCPIVVDGNISDDDLTLQLVEIVKWNNTLIGEMDEEKLKNYSKLKFRISTLFDNRQSKAKHTTNQRPLKGISERISGKKGILRENLMGKRVEQSARSVIGADPTLKLDEIGIPEYIADTLYYPEIVTDFNKEKLEYIVNNGDASYVIKKNGSRITLNYALYKKGTQVLCGDTIIRKLNGIEKHFAIKDKEVKLLQGDKIIRNGKELDKIEFPSKRYYKLEVGEVVHRKLQKGDVLLLNRQPTLHAGSMMAMKVVPRRGFNQKTITMNLCVCKPFNADFDGDEMNLHAPASVEARVELEELSDIKKHIITGQTSTPIIVIVQDSLLGSYKMTKQIEDIPRSAFFNMCCYSTLDTNKIQKKLNHILKVYKSLGIKPRVFSGKSLFSMTLPDDFNYENDNGADKKFPVVKIRNGVLYEGIITKANIGGSSKSIIQYLYKEYSQDVVCDFINNVQFISTQYNLYYSFSVGIGDCIASKEDEIGDSVKKCLLEAEEIEKITINPSIREIRINAALNKAGDIGKRIAKNALKDNNSFNDTVLSGAKGDYFNIAQITGLLGQQNINGNRIPRHLNDGSRSLPHYPLNEELSLEEKYESRGFIKNSFIHGLNPKEFFFHAMSGRIGICDTAMGTATSGYIQRRIGKCTEDIQIKYDGTVRDVTDTVIQPYYGDGFDYKQSVYVKGELQCCDVSRIAEKLRIKREISNEGFSSNEDKKIVEKVVKKKIVNPKKKTDKKQV